MNKTSINWDIWGFTTSLLCAIHCAVLPLILSFGILGQSFQWMDHPAFEWIVIVLTSFFVYQSIWKGYRNGKVRKSTVYMALSGLVLLFLHHYLGFLSTPLVVLGGLLIAISHFRKLYFDKNGQISDNQHYKY